MDLQRVSVDLGWGRGIRLANRVWAILNSALGAARFYSVATGKGRDWGLVGCFKDRLCVLAVKKYTIFIH